MAPKRKRIAASILEGAREAAAIARGELEPARVVRVPLSAREVEVPRPPRYTAERIRRVRRKMGLSQTLFARALNVSEGTERAWEQGRRSPAGPSLRLLELAEREPEVFLRTLRQRDRKAS